MGALLKDLRGKKVTGTVLVETSLQPISVLILSHLTEHADVLLLQSSPPLFFLTPKSLPCLAGHVAAHAEAGLVQTGNCWSYTVLL